MQIMNRNEHLKAIDLIKEVKNVENKDFDVTYGDILPGDQFQYYRFLKSFYLIERHFTSQRRLDYIIEMEKTEPQENRVLYFDYERTNVEKFLV